MPYFRLSQLVFTTMLVSLNGTCATLTEPSGHKTWNSQRVLNCDKQKMTLTTSCLEEQADGLPLCPGQKIEIEGPGVRKVIEYKHAINGGDQEFITQAECFRKDSQAYLVLTATNFGNCAGCEWEDVFSPDGTYIGSTSGVYTNAGFKHKSLSQTLRKEVRTATVDKYRTADTGTIPRAKPQP